MTAAVIEGTRRARILAHLSDHPDLSLTCHEVARVIGSPSTALAKLLTDMEAKAQLVSATQRRPGQGRPVRMWRLAPPGSVPAPAPVLSPEAIERRRAAWRLDQRRRRAQVAVPVRVLPPIGACCTADADLFFGPDREDREAREAREAKAIAICAACPARATCLEYAQETGQVAGVWGGVSFEPAQALGRTS